MRKSFSDFSITSLNLENYVEKIPEELLHNLKYVLAHSEDSF